MRRTIESTVDPAQGWRAFATRAAEAVVSTVGGDMWCVAAADPATLLMSDVVAGADLGGGPRFFQLEYGEDDFLLQRDLARGRSHAGALSRATDGRLERSPRWREMIEPFGFGDQLRAALVSKHGCWGYIGIEREPGSAFGPDDVASVAAIVSRFAEGLRLSLLREVASSPSRRSGVALLVLDEDLSLVSVTDEDGLFEGDVAPGSRPPHGVMSVAARLRAGGGTGSVSAHMASTSGWITLTASMLRSQDDAGRTAVIAQATRGDTMSLLSAIYRFTRREADIVRLVLRGAPTAEISSALHISSLTVQQHLKSIFEKADVGSRSELVGHILQRHFVDLGTDATTIG